MTLYDLPGFLDALSDLWTPDESGAWRRVVWADTPSGSAQGARTFAFREPIKSEPMSVGTDRVLGTGAVFLYTVPTRFVVHARPNEDATALVQGVYECVDRARYYSPTGDLATGFVWLRVLGSDPPTRVQGRTIEVVRDLTLAVYERAPGL